MKKFIIDAAAWIHGRRTLLIYTWFVLSLFGSSAVRIVGIVCGSVLIAAWVIATRK